MKPTAEQIADQDRRSTPVGYFNFAESYYVAAKVLRRSKTKASHKHAPIRFVYYHAIELYLKSYLRGNGVGAFVLSTKVYGHDVQKLLRDAEKFGLSVDDEDQAVYKLMAETDTVIRSRYLSTGFFNWPDISALDRTCKSLRVTIAKDLAKKGHKVRLQ